MARRNFVSNGSALAGTLTPKISMAGAIHPMIKLQSRILDALACNTIPVVAITMPTELVNWRNSPVLGIVVFKLTIGSTIKLIN